MRLGHLYALQGRYAEAKGQFEREIEFVGRVDLALKARIFIELHTRLGAALLGLRDEAGGRATLDPLLDQVRGEPRFRALVEA